MTFVSVKTRLVVYLHGQLRNGGITERGLATKVGLSQSHIHNVLKGERDLSGEAADRIMEGMGLTVLDLFERDEIVLHLSCRPFEREGGITP
jgi:hypothetical protein